MTTKREKMILEEWALYKSRVASGINHSGIPFKKAHLRKLRRELATIPEGKAFELFKAQWGWS